MTVTLVNKQYVGLFRYWDTLLEMFWPRFTFVIQQNIESIRLIDPQKMGSIDVQPHYVSVSLMFEICTRSNQKDDNDDCWYIICQIHFTAFHSTSLYPNVIQSNQEYYVIRSVSIFAEMFVPSFQITRRYAEFSAAIVSLNESFPDEKVGIRTSIF